MNFLETYAANCGAKIGSPYIYTTFFPLPFEKYITFHSDSEGNAKNYDYLQDVINILTPALKADGIKIVQIGNPTDRIFANCVSLKGAASQNQIAYIIQHSMLHFGADGFPTHLAGGFDVPIVSLFSNNYVNCDKPYFGSPEKQIFLNSYERTTNKKPSFANEENPKTINLIKPEEIVISILKLLKIDYEIPFDSIFFGKKYSNFIVQEVIPNHRNILFNPEQMVEIRLDSPFYKEEDFFYLLMQYKKSVLIMDKPVNLNILKQFKQNIAMVVFKITEVDQKEYLAQLEALGLKTMLVSELPEARISELKIKYYEFGLIIKVEQVAEEKISELKKEVNRLFFRSSKITASDSKFYASAAAVAKESPIQNNDEYQKVIDSPDFWKDLDFYTIVKRK